MDEKIGPYRVVEQLGVGGMGEVYKAYDDRLDRWVAIVMVVPDGLVADLVPPILRQLAPEIA